MTGSADCRDIRHALGVYVLGAIDPAERAAVDSHLSMCPECREELAGLAGLPALLRRIPVGEAQQLADEPDDELAGTDMPSDQVLDSLLTRTSRARQARRWRGLAAAAAVVLVAGAAGAAGWSALNPPAGGAWPARHWDTSSASKRRRACLGHGPVHGQELGHRGGHPGARPARGRPVQPGGHRRSGPEGRGRQLEDQLRRGHHLVPGGILGDAGQRAQLPDHLTAGRVPGHASRRS